MRIAYLVLAHEHPQHLRRLTEALASESSAVFIHLDRKSRRQDFSDVAGPTVHFADERVRVYRYHFSHIEAVMVLLRLALADDRGFQRFLLLSGTDYPLRSTQYVDEFFERHRGVEFMNIVPIPCEAAGKPLWRLTTYKPHPGAPGVVRAVRRLRLKLGAASAPRDHMTHLKGLKPFGGSEWWALTRESCEYLREFARARPHVMAFFENVVCPQESLYQTVLGNSPHRGNITRNLTFTDWSAGGSSPAWLGPEHIDHFASVTRVELDDVYGTGEALFARKFSDRSAHLVNRIDEIRRSR